MSLPTDPTNPIDPSRFAAALESLPLDALHAKAAEISNSISHLRHSNAQMLPFADDGDQDCKEAMFENLTVIGRMNERVRLLRAEVERRGLPWSAEGEDQEEGEGQKVNGVVEAPMTNGVVTNGAATVNSVTSGEVPAQRAPSGRLTDEELRRQLEAQVGGDDEEEDAGVHL